MNNVILIGRLTRDPELRYTAGTGVAMCRFTLAVDRGLSRDKKMEMEQKGQPTADFIGCIAWGKTAELVANYLSKGRQVAIQGRIQTSSYDGQDGNRVYRTDVVAERVEFIGSNPSSGQGMNTGFNQVNNYNQNAGFNQDVSDDNFGLGDDAFPLNDEDIPF
ncbi:single-stranded DNA-binding protein [Miniphocaeibacter halophilus]|uniref:Single-stranded DNA-binding protein n=1 Tax=Miniphocaeibacter halophilus TaxID=2931922 RepID=A0AC61MV17_9FIRM|nr:single-stranded DNA-binding protein [Miniphocaeibacter halophilus]QQK08011.1 single-stranded DNA-binding protein [Miniphocaeibacter halophilus]